MRVGGILFRGCVITGILGSCSSSAAPRSVSYSVASDQTGVDRVTGTWVRGAITVEICDDRSKTFCAEDRCTTTPCHDVTRAGKDETLSYEPTGPGCDGCYGCECYDVRIGLPITVRVIEDGTMTNFTGTAVASGRVANALSGWELLLYNTALPRTGTTVPLRWGIEHAGEGGSNALILPSADAANYLGDRYEKTRGGVCP